MTSALRRVPPLMIVDLLVLLGFMALIALVRFGWEWPTYPRRHYAVGFMIAALVHVGIYYFGGLFEPEPRLGYRSIFPRVASLTVVAVLIDALIAFVTGRYLMPRANLAALLVLGTLGVSVAHSLARWRRRRKEGRPRVLLVGAPEEVLLARRHMPEAAAHPAIVGETREAERLVDKVQESGATDVLLLSGDMLDSVYPGPLTELEQRGVGILLRVSARDTLLGLEGVREIGGMPFVALGTHTLPESRVRFKRILDLIATLLVLPLLTPVLAALALYVRVVIGRPVLFWQERVGRYGSVFRLVKFRTMRPDAEEGSGPVLSSADDPRVLPGAQWLRDLRLDELPQLWNVLKGEMSIVGPRPERPELAERFERLIPGYFRRHQIPPGITGLAQVHGRYDTDPEYKLGYDLQYLVNWSPTLDLQILARTVWVVLQRRI